MPRKRRLKPSRNHLPRAAVPPRELLKRAGRNSCCASSIVDAGEQRALVPRRVRVRAVRSRWQCRAALDLRMAIARRPLKRPAALIPEAKARYKPKESLPLCRKAACARGEASSTQARASAAQPLSGASRAVSTDGDKAPRIGLSMACVSCQPGKVWRRWPSCMCRLWCFVCCDASSARPRAGERAA